MKISYNWLRDYLDFDHSPDQISNILTNTGLEVEKHGPRFKNIDSFQSLVIGKIESIQDHPNADKLKVTKVDTGSGLKNIICGASNIKKNDFVAVALCGTKITNLDGVSLKIQKVKIRGEVSEGMICSEHEIGLGFDNDGVIIFPENQNLKIGLKIWDYLNLKQDYYYEIGLTPNRTDAFGHIGVARDIKSVLNLSERVYALKKPNVELKIDNENLPFSVVIEDKKECPRYCGVTLQGVKIEDSPNWLKQKLISIGLKPINNIVDVTNFVLFETGSPLHAFDYDKIDSSSIFVGKQNKIKKFNKLTGEEIDLHQDDLLIHDRKKALCLAGVMGGDSSSISEETKNIFLESAFFSPTLIRKTSKRHNISTDSSYRFERGVDIDNCLYALKRACILIKSISGARISANFFDSYNQEEGFLKQISFSCEKFNKMTGFDIDQSVIRNILNDLGFIINDSKPNDRSDFFVTVPNYRFDVSREIDVFEEVLRIYGYDNIPMSKNVSFSVMGNNDSFKDFDVKKLVSESLCNSGFFEIKNNSLMSFDLLGKLTQQSTLVKILNASSNDLNALRNTLLFGGLQSVKYNLNRQNKNLRFFEFGNTYFLHEKKYMEKMKLSLFLSGDSCSESWSQKVSKMDLFWAKGFVVKIFNRLNINPNLVLNNDKLWGEYLSFEFEEQEIVSLKNVPSNILGIFGIKQNVIYVDFNWEVFLKSSSSKKVSFSHLPKFPKIRRDLSLLLNKDILFNDLKKDAFISSKKLLKDVIIFDVFVPKDMVDKKSYAVGFIFQDYTKTLTDDIINKEIKRIFCSFQEKFDVQLRDGELN